MSNLAEIPTYYLLFSFNFSKKIFKHNCPIENRLKKIFLSKMVHSWKIGEEKFHKNDHRGHFR